MAATDEFRLLYPDEIKLPFRVTGSRGDWQRAATSFQLIAGQPWILDYQKRHELDPGLPFLRMYKSKNGSPNLIISAYRINYINLSTTRFDKIELLRYLAQYLIPTDVAWHGPEFVRAFLYCISNEIGPEAANQMDQLFGIKKVRRRVMSKEVQDRKKANAEKQRTKRAIVNLQRTLNDLESHEEPSAGSHS